MQQGTNQLSEEGIRKLLRAARLTANHLSDQSPLHNNEELQAWLAQDPQHMAWYQNLTDPARLSGLSAEYVSLQALTNMELERFEKNYLTPAKVSPIHRVHFFETAWFRYAAILLILAGTSTFLYKAYQEQQQEIAKNQSVQQPDIQPGGNKAILTLSDGSTIVLDSAANGALAQQGNSHVIKSGNGLVRYESEKNDRLEGPAIAYNTIATPKGGQYQIVLPDRSKVWLNAASSVRFPTAFSKDRRVTVTGEVYFEIAQDKEKPFIVSSTGTDIQVLGTSFNVNAYPDEPAVKISVSDGRVKIGPVILQPGSACVAGKVVATNIEQDLAWKNGWFSFTDADLPTVMRQLTRWYNVEVHYEGAIPTKLFNGKIDKNLSLSQVLRVLTKTRVNYSIENNRITIRP